MNGWLRDRGVWAGALLAVALAGCGGSSSAAPAVAVVTPGTQVVVTPVTTRGGLPAYGAQLLPVLQRTMPLLDWSAAQAERDPVSCGSVENQVLLLEDEADGVPHPDPWYLPVGRMHHRVMGAFHLALGAMEACVTAEGNGDRLGTAQAVADLAHGAVEMHQVALDLHRVLGQG